MLKGLGIFFGTSEKVNHTISRGSGFKFHSFPKNHYLGKISNHEIHVSRACSFWMIFCHR